jgi:hypothetical protein
MSDWMPSERLCPGDGRGSGLRLWVHHDGFTAHGSVLLPALRRPMLLLEVRLVSIWSSAAMAVSTCLRSRMYGGRNRSTVSLVRLMMMRRAIISKLRLLGQVGGVEFQSKHQPRAADVGDAIVAAAKRFELLLKVAADFANVASRFVCFMVSITAMATAQASGPPPKVVPCIPGVIARAMPRRCTASRPSAGRQPSAWPGGDVRLDAKVLIGEPLAGAPQAGLDLVGEKQGAGRIAELARRGEELLRDRMNAAPRPGWVRCRWRRPRSRNWRADRPHR